MKCQVSYRGYLRPPQDIQIKMREFVARYGEAIAFDHFGISRGTVARVAAGLGVQGTTLRAVEEGLSTPVPERVLP